MHLDIFHTTLQPNDPHIAQAVVYTSLSVDFPQDLSRAEQENLW